MGLKVENVENVSEDPSMNRLFCVSRNAERMKNLGGVIFAIR